jgi:hypothetical protein
MAPCRTAALAGRIRPAVMAAALSVIRRHAGPDDVSRTKVVNTVHRLRGFWPSNGPQPCFMNNDANQCMELQQVQFMWLHKASEQNCVPKFTSGKSWVYAAARIPLD